MQPDILISFRHCPHSAQPRYVKHEDVERVAMQVRRQLGHGDDDLVVDVERLAQVSAARVNGITYALEWCFNAHVRDDVGDPAFGVCEFDSALPDLAQIHINNELIGQREAVLRSTCLHEFGHGIFDAPAWVWAHQRQSASLFELPDKDCASRVCRTITTNETHLTSTPPATSPEYFRELRANEFMGSVCAPRALLGPQFRRRCEGVGLDHRDIKPNAPEPLLTGSAKPATALAEPVIDLNYHGTTERLEAAIRQLATDFRLTPRFIEVRLKRYGFIRQAVTVA